jgi:hypothetical protein
MNFSAKFALEFEVATDKKTKKNMQPDLISPFREAHAAPRLRGGLEPRLGGMFSAGCKAHSSCIPEISHGV